MDETCCGGEGAGAQVCELPLPAGTRGDRAASLCPACGERGKAVEVITVKAMLGVSLREIRASAYRFCRTRSCPVVYFSIDGSQTFEVGQVRERVFQKEPEAEDVNICYCFQHTVGEMMRADEGLRTSIVRDIEEGIAAGQCGCEVRNPQGSCCLGNVRGLVKPRPAKVGQTA